MNAMPLPQTRILAAQLRDTMRQSSNNLMYELERLSREKENLVGRLGNHVREFDRILAAWDQVDAIDDPAVLELLANIREQQKTNIQLLREAAPDEAWYWSDAWQEGERDIAAEEVAGHTDSYQSADDFARILTANRR